MYTMTCDGHLLLDTRDDDYILGSPRVKTEVNTVGEGSFRIYFNHPNFDKLKPLRSIFEAKDEYGVLFRGRMTEDTKDFYNCKDVDLEGAMSYFNDSVVRPYVFPDDFEEDAEYKAAAAESPEQAAIDGGVVRFLLKWYIDRHNEQVEPFQQFKLGNVTVYDKNNFIERATSAYPSTWTEISEKTFNSSLGGYLCIRYEADGNYIDYLREFTEVNEQGITYGENMLDISQNTNASETYSAIIPLGADVEITESTDDVYEGMYGDIVGGSTVTKKLTIEDLPDGNITDDIVKKGDMLYSKSAVEAYGLRIAPTDETTWDEVETPQNLQSNGVEFLEGDSSKIPNTIKVMAVDLNCTDSQIRSFRIYKKIPVDTQPHGVNADFDLTALDIDLLDPQNTKITVGKTATTITEYQTRERNQIQKVLFDYAPKTQVVKALNHVGSRFSDYAKIEQLQELIKQALNDMNIVTEDKLEETLDTKLEDHVKKEDLEGYAKKEDLDDYVTEDTVKDLIDEAIQNSGNTGDNPDGNKCDHVDADGDGVCDKCGEPYSGGGEPCGGHVDADDDGICDICGEPFSDGEESCEHSDEYDTGICDICGEFYTNGKDDSTYESREYDDGLLTTLWRIDVPYLYEQREIYGGTCAVESAAGGTLMLPDNGHDTFPIIIEMEDPILSATITFFEDVVVDDAFVEEHVRVSRIDDTEVECHYLIINGSLRLYYPGDFDNPHDMKIMLDWTDVPIKHLIIETVD